MDYPPFDQFILLELLQVVSIHAKTTEGQSLPSFHSWCYPNFLYNVFIPNLVLGVHTSIYIFLSLWCWVYFPVGSLTSQHFRSYIWVVKVFLKLEWCFSIMNDALSTFPFHPTCLSHMIKPPSISSFYIMDARYLNCHLRI